MPNVSATNPRQRVERSPNGRCDRNRPSGGTFTPNFAISSRPLPISNYSNSLRPNETRISLYVRLGSFEYGGFFETRVRRTDYRLDRIVQKRRDPRWRFADTNGTYSANSTIVADRSRAGEGHQTRRRRKTTRAHPVACRHRGRGG